MNYKCLIMWAQRFALDFSLLFPFKFQINRRFHGLMGHKPMTLDVDLHIQKGRMQDVKLKVCHLKLHTSCRTSIYTGRKQTRKRICFLDLCRCSMWTLNYILYEPICKWCHFRFRGNINEPILSLYWSVKSFYSQKYRQARWPYKSGSLPLWKDTVTSLF